MKLLFALLTIILITTLPVALTDWLGMTWGLIVAFPFNIAALAVSGRALREEK